MQKRNKENYKVIKNSSQGLLSGLKGVIENNVLQTKNRDLCDEFHVSVK
jgi:hypothetical protein